MLNNLKTVARAGRGGLVQDLILTNSASREHLTGSAAILCTGGLDVIRKEAWSFYRTISGVCLCCQLEEPEGPKGSTRVVPPFS